MEVKMNEPKTSTVEADQKVTKPTQPSIGSTRQVVVEILSESKDGLTIKAVERAVGGRQPALTRDVVENVVEGLIQDELVERDQKDSRRLTLTHGGTKFASGLRALAAG